MLELAAFLVVAYFFINYGIPLLLLILGVILYLLGFGRD